MDGNSEGYRYDKCQCGSVEGKIIPQQNLFKGKRDPMMSNVIMMCGVCGSGKTTYAKQKEEDGYVSLSIDEELWKTYGRKG